MFRFCVSHQNHPQASSSQLKYFEPVFVYIYIPASGLFFSGTLLFLLAFFLTINCRSESTKKTLKDFSTVLVVGNCTEYLQRHAPSLQNK